MTDTTEDQATTPIATLDLVVFDVPEPAVAGAFWRGLTGATEVEDDDGGWVTLETPDGWRLGFQQAPDLVRAEWPGQEHPQQLHLDLRVPDVGAAVGKAVELGATVLRENESWTTLADPVGHPFGLCLAGGAEGLTVAGVTFRRA